MMLIGLTGGIASGKTLVSNTFKNLGVAVIDADIVARSAVAIGSVGLQQLSDHFGNEILNTDVSLNRSALREIIFADNNARKIVDGILHPIIRKLSDEQIHEAKMQGHIYAIYVVPLLVETKQQNRFDRIIVVDVSKKTQIDRLMLRDNTTQEKALAILEAQATREQRLAIADDVIDNEGRVEKIYEKVQALHETYLEMASNN